MAKLRVSPKRRLGIDLAGSEYELVRQLVAFRRKHGYTQAEVAERMGVSRTTVSQFENLNGGPTKNHTLLTVKRYAEAVNAYVDHIAVDAGTAAEDGDRASYAPLRDAVIEHRKALEATPHCDVSASTTYVLNLVSEMTFTDAFPWRPTEVHNKESFAETLTAAGLHSRNLNELANAKRLSVGVTEWASATPARQEMVSQ